MKIVLTIATVLILIAMFAGSFLFGVFASRVMGPVSVIPAGLVGFGIGYFGVQGIHEIWDYYNR